MTRRLIAVAAMALTLSGTPAWAQPPVQYQCMTQLTECYYWAAGRAGFWVMWAAGIDCELAAVDCIRRAIMGQ